ncbi:MAG: hypothetical protein ACPL4K_04755, partial [Candidatus Margulisiibacteriota bacterium]
QNSQLASTYLGGKIYLYFDTLCRTIFSNETQTCIYAFPITLGIEGKIGTLGTVPNSTFFRQPDLKINASLWWKYLNLNGSANLQLNPREEHLDTYYLGAAIRPFADSSSSWLQELNLNLDYNNFNFTYLGDRRPRKQIGFGLNWNLPITDGLQLQLNAKAINYLTKQELNDDSFWRQNWGAEFGISTQVDLFKWLKININYTRQQNNEYPINTFNIFLLFQF